MGGCGAGFNGRAGSLGLAGAGMGAGSGLLQAAVGG